MRPTAPGPADTPPVPWHACPVSDVLQRLETTPAGLDAAQARARRARHGPNRLPEAPRRGPLRRFALQFHNVLIYVLIGSAAVTALLGHWIDTGVILAVVVANAIVGFLQEGKAERAMDAIRAMLAPQAHVLRDGQRCTVDAGDLVPGDVVLLEAGDRVPADLRLLAAFGLAIQEAVLTGESVPVEKDVAAVAADAPLGDRSGMAFGGTLVAAGQATGVVVATGAATEVGRISGLLAGVEQLQTPLLRQMDRFARWLTGLILLAAGVLLAYGVLARGEPFPTMFMAVVGLSVAAIPEGLPAALTIALAIGVQAMARRNAIVRRLPAIETVGAVSVICTDKTGTLTRNEMAVATALTADARYRVEGLGHGPAGTLLDGDRDVDPAGQPLLRELARAAALCNDAALCEREGDWCVEGDPMEGALLAFAARVGHDGHWPRLHTLPFDARHRYMATLHADDAGEAAQRHVFVKGAPERVLAMCAWQRGANGDLPLDAAWWHAQADAIAGDGQRVLAIATRHHQAADAALAHADVDGGLVLLGLVGLIDPPREEAVAAVEECRRAGIQVKMITGDHARTAAAIGHRVGLPDGPVLTGQDLDALDDDALARAVLDCHVFARTSPEHKLRLVGALQAHGLTVAMTGDGVNDAPALKRADVGIAMGRKGSEAAKEAADLVLADDNFATIAAAVREGRTVYDNIRKVVSWTLPTNAGEAMTIVFALLAGWALPVTPVQILWVNLVTAITLGLALAFEPTEPGSMRRPPRARDAPLVSAELAWHILLAATLFLAIVSWVFHDALARGHRVELARTLALNMLVVLEIAHLFYVRNIHGTSLTWRAVRGTRVVWLTVVAVTAAQLAITYLPALQRVFGTVAVPLQDGARVLALGALFLVVIEIEKQLRLRLFWRRSRVGPQPSGTRA